MSNEEELYAVVYAAIAPVIAEWRRIAGEAQAEAAALRAQVAELESGPDWAEFRQLRQLAESGAKAVEVLEQQGEQARARIAELERALDSYGDFSRNHDAIRRVLAGNSAGNSPAGSQGRDG